MSSRQSAPLVFANLRGRDGSTASVGVPPAQGGIPLDKCAEALNVDWYRTSFARKRGGAANVSLTFSSGGPFTGVISSLIAHQPGAVLSASELWAFDVDFVVGRLAGATQWTAPTLKDAVTSTAFATGVSLNGKLFLAYASAAQRLHVWDGSTVRRVGLGAVNTAPAVANTGAGTYAAVLRYYRQRYLVMSGTTILRASEASDAAPFTPSGAGTAVQITKSSAVSEGETHWQIEVSLDNAVWYVLTSVVVGTTTYDDSAATTTYSQGDAAPLAGAYTNFAALRYLTTDGNRLLGCGNADGSQKQNRVFFSPVMGTTSASFADEEYTPTTVEQKNYIDLDENDGDIIMGLSRPFQGTIWAFKLSQLFRLVPTGIDTAPYKVIPAFKDLRVGCVGHKSIVMAVDEAGRPAMYWLSPTGPYRIGVNGLEAMVDDIQDVWDTVIDRVRVTDFVFHGVYHHDKHQIWWWIPSSANTNNKKIVFDVLLGRSVNGRVRGGWSVHDGISAAAQCSAMFANTLGASMSADLKPHIGRASGTTVLKCDTSDTSDNGTAFQSYVTLPDRHYGGVNHECAVTGAAAIGSAGSHTLTLTLTRDYGEESRTSTATFTAGGSETRKLKAFEGAAMADADAVQIKVGDASAVANAWTLDALLVKIEQRSEQAQA